MNIIYTDTSVLTTDYQEQLETFTYENIYDETIINLDPTDTTDEVIYAGIFFRSNILGTAQMRTFEKIGKFIGYIGGFWSMLYLFFSVVAKKYNGYKLLIKMANSLYTVSNVDIKSINSHKSPNPAKVREKVKKNKFEVERIEKKSKTLVDDKIKNLMDQDKGLKLPTDFKSFLRVKISSFFGLNKFLSQNNPYLHQLKLEEHALLAIQKDTDIIQLLTKIKEITKFKNIFLNPIQQKLFDFFSKEKISKMGRESRNASRSSFLFLRKSMRFSSLKNNSHVIVANKEIQDLYEAFKLVWTNQSEKMNNLLLNERILENFDKDLLNCFEEKYNKEEHVGKQDELKNIASYS